MQSFDEQLTNEQLNLKNNPKLPPHWNDPNPEMYASPFMWDSLYTSPAWGHNIQQMGSGYSTVDNQFTSAVTQPISLSNTQWEGQEIIPTANSNKIYGRMYGGMVEPSYEWWDTQGKNFELQPIRGNGFMQDIQDIVKKKQKGGFFKMPSQKFKSIKERLGEGHRKRKRK